MAVTTPLSLSAIRTEFGDTLGNDGLSEYVRGGNWVRNHDNNAAISSSVGGLAISQFLNSDKDFDSIYGNNGGKWNFDGTLNSINEFSYEIFVGFSAASTGYLFPEMTGFYSGGSTNNFLRAGYGNGVLDQVLIRSAFDWGTGNDFFSTVPTNFTLALEGNQVGGIAWNAVVITIDGYLGPGANFLKSNATGPGGPNGFYNSTYGLTYWIWRNTPAGFNDVGTATGTFRIELVF